MKKSLVSIVGNLVSLVISLIVLLPLAVLFINSFKTSAEANRMTLSLKCTPNVRQINLTFGGVFF